MISFWFWLCKKNVAIVYLIMEYDCYEIHKFLHKSVYSDIM